MTTATDRSTDRSAATPRRSVRCAVSVMRDGTSARTELGSFLDEELSVLEDETGIGGAPAWMPWAERHPEEADAAAETVRRLLLHRRHLVPEGAAAELEDREPEGPEADLVADPTTTGTLLLRRSAAAVTTGLRTFAVEDGLREMRCYFYHQENAVSLEEIVTAEGAHRFAILPTSQVAERLQQIVDPQEVADQDGEMREIPSSTPPEDWGESIAEDTRYLTRLLTTAAAAPVLHGASFHATHDGVHVVEPDDLTDFTAELAPGAPGPDADAQSLLRIARLSPRSLREVLDQLVRSEDADEDAEA